MKANDEFEKHGMRLSKNLKNFLLSVHVDSKDAIIRPARPMERLRTILFKDSGGVPSLDRF